MLLFFDNILNFLDTLYCNINKKTGLGKDFPRKMLFLGLSSVQFSKTADSCWLSH